MISSSPADEDVEDEEDRQWRRGDEDVEDQLMMPFFQ